MSCFIWAARSILMASVRAAVSTYQQCAQFAGFRYRWGRPLCFDACGCTPADSIDSPASVSDSQNSSSWIYSIPSTCLHRQRTYLLRGRRILHQILPQQGNMQLLVILLHRLLTLPQLLSISIAPIEQIPLQKAVSTLLAGGHVEPVTEPVNLPRILVLFPVNRHSVEMCLLRHAIFCCSEERAAEQVLLVAASVSPSWTDIRRDHQKRRSIYVGL